MDDSTSLPRFGSWNRFASLLLFCFGTFSASVSTAELAAVSFSPALSKALPKKNTWLGTPDKAAFWSKPVLALASTITSRHFLLVAAAPVPTISTPRPPRRVTGWEII